jgi:hypothetical protein
VSSTIAIKAVKPCIAQQLIDQVLGSHLRAVQPIQAIWYMSTTAGSNSLSADHAHSHIVGFLHMMVNLQWHLCLTTQSHSIL